MHALKKSKYLDLGTDCEWHMSVPNENWLGFVVRPSDGNVNGDSLILLHSFLNEIYL